VRNDPVEWPINVCPSGALNADAELGQAGTRVCVTLQDER
jgi:hypothetical protein